MARYTPVKVSTQELAALAFAAARVNNGKVYKEERFYDKDSDSLITVTPNKILMRDNSLPVTDADRAEAVDAINLLNQDCMMRVLKKLKIADFQNTLNNLVSQEQATMKDAGLMAFLPSMAEQIRQRQTREEEMAGLAVTSQYLGKEGEKIKFTITVMTSRWMQQFNCWSVNGKDSDGNLVSYFTSNESCTRSGSYTAKIKRIEESRYHNGAKVTTVNFVKPF